MLEEREYCIFVLLRRVIQESIDITSKNNPHVLPDILSLGRENFFHVAVYTVRCFSILALTSLPLSLTLSSTGNFDRSLGDNRHLESSLLLPYRVTHIPREPEENRAATKFHAG